MLRCIKSTKHNCAASDITVLNLRDENIVSEKYVIVIFLQGLKKKKMQLKISFFYSYNLNLYKIIHNLYICICMNEKINFKILLFE